MSSETIPLAKEQKEELVLGETKISSANARRFEDARRALHEGRLDTDGLYKGKDDLRKEFWQLNKKEEIASSKGETLTDAEKQSIMERSKELDQEIAMFEALLNEAAKMENNP